MRIHPLLFLPFVLVAADCGGKRVAPPGGSSTPDAPEARTTLLPHPDEATGLQLRLSEAGSLGDDAPAGPRTVNGEALSRAEVAALLRRTDELPAAEDADVALRDRSLPPPRTGDTVDLPFPPPGGEAAPEVPTGPVQIVRVRPDADVPMAPRVSVTFDRPMVALTTADEAARRVPVTLTPEPPGAWRWLGTRTVVFEASSGRLPAATDYRVRIPAGTEAPDGSTLVEAFEQSFATPPVTLRGHVPRGGVPTDAQPVIALVFDQDVSDAGIRRHVVVTVDGEPIEVELASPEQIAADERARAVVDAQPPARVVALVPKAPIPIRRTPRQVQVTLPPGTPSAEGPRPTVSDQSFAFEVHGALGFEKLTCGWNDRCPPGAAVQLQFTNELLATQALHERIRIEPAVPGLQVYPSGRTLTLRANTAPETTYRVLVDPSLEDVFDQTLGESVRASFTTDSANPPWPHAWAPGGTMQVADPFADPSVRLVTRGVADLQVVVSRVTPEQFEAWRAGDRHRDLAASKPLGDVVSDERMRVEDLSATEVLDVPLGKHLEGEYGHFVVRFVHSQRARRGDPRSIAQEIWVQVTHLGVSTLTDADELLAVVTDLTTGRPVPGAEVTFDQARADTDERGVARIVRPEGALRVRRGDDVALLTSSDQSRRPGAWKPSSGSQQTIFHVFDDRGLVKPGETLHAKGWVRRVDLREDGDVLPVDGSLDDTKLSWTVLDATRIILAQGEVRLDDWGAFSLDIPIPDTPNLGVAYLGLRGAGGNHSHAFEIREFRTPEFEVGSAVLTEGPHVLGGSTTLEATAHYYAGGGLAGADVRWTARAETASWSPAGWEGFRFGRWEPVWWHRPWGLPMGGRTETWTLESKTDATGAARLAVDAVSIDAPRTSRVTVGAAIQDVNYQTWSASSSFLVHPSSRYVGVRPTKGFYEPDDAVEVDLVVVDLDGAAVPLAELDVTLVRTVHRFREGAWTEEEAERHACVTTTTADEPVTCRFEPEEGGRFLLTARTVDAEGRLAETTTPIWVSGGTPMPRAEGVSQQSITLVPDADRWSVGETARFLATLPFEGGTVRISYERAGVLHTEVRELDGATTTVEVPLEAMHVPNVMLRVEAWGVEPRAEGADLLQPAWASGAFDIDVPPAVRSLDVEVTVADPELQPGDSTDVEVLVRDADGEPVADAQVVLVVVDEAVLALTGHEIPDPLGTFHPHRWPGSSLRSSYGWVRLVEELEETEARESAPAEVRSGYTMDAGGAMPRGGVARQLKSMGYVEGEIAEEASFADEAMPMAASTSAPPPPDAGPAIAVRSDFRPDAVFLPDATTDASGRLITPIVLPDNLTRYRVTAVVADDHASFGLGTADVTARLPLMLRPSPPRFLNLGDEAAFALVLQNQTTAPMTVEVAMAASNATVEGGGAAGRRVTVPADDRVQVRLPVSTVRPGEASFQAVASAARHADAARFDLPVWTPATREAFATYGHLDGPDALSAVSQSVDVPDDVLPQVGGLEIQLATTKLQALTDAFLYLRQYPYECSEQISSRLLSVVALRDVLDAFEAEGLPPAEELRASVDRDVERLVRMQRPDGTWGFWTTNERVAPWATLSASHALVRARAAGFEVPQGALDKALRELGRPDGWRPPHWSDRAWRVVKAHAVMIRHLHGIDTEVEALRLVRELGDLDDEALSTLGLLLPALVDADAPEVATILHRFRQEAVEEAGTAQWVTSWSEDDAALLLHGDRRTDAILLDAMLQVDADDAMLPKVVEGLLGHREQGRWAHTQENVWVLLALHRYFTVAEAVTPDLVAQAWLGPDFAGQHAFRGRTTDTARLKVPMDRLAGEGPQDLVLARRGEGRLYYRLGLDYAPTNLALEPAERGFSVQRRYEAVDDPADVRRDDDGTWRVRAGARVRVHLDMVAPARRYHVALTDPLPAGFEPLDPALAVTEDLPTPPDADDPWSRPWWWGRWYGHENLRDERVEAFSRLVWGGVYTYSYTARATTPGTYTAPPARAEEMYHPQTFGRSGTDRVVVE